MLYHTEVYQRPFWPQVRAYYSKTYYGFTMPVHAHPSAEVMYVFSGESDVYVQDAGSEPFTLNMRAGDFIFLNGGVRHRLLVKEKMQSTMLNAEFTLSPCEGMFTLQNLRRESGDYDWFVSQKAQCAFGKDLYGDLFQAMDALVRGLENLKQPRCLHRGEMSIFLMQLARCLRKDREKGGDTEHVRKATALIRQNYMRPLNIAALARRLEISGDHLGRLFHAETGTTLARYLEKVRIDHAAVLLERSELPIGDIAEQVGFGNRQRFHAAFQRTYGFSPREYRKRRRANLYPQVNMQEET